MVRVVTVARRHAIGSYDAQKWNWIVTVIGTLLFVFCLLVALTQFVNPFPEDGWFESQYRIFGRSPGADNYTPVAVPAFVYALVHFVVSVFGYGLAAEFYLGSLLHHLLLFLSGVFLYLSHCCLKLPKSGLTAAVLLVVSVESTLLPQAFWSENVTLCLMSAILLIAVAIMTTPRLGDRGFLVLTVVFGLLLGGLTITRLIPLAILPGLILLYWFYLSRQRAIRFALLATVIVFVIVFAAMSANLYRYGRFELSNSIGRHLWNVVSLRSDEMLAESREYQIVKRAIPHPQGKYWWEIHPYNIHGLGIFTHEELFRILSAQAVSRHPIPFLAIGVQNTSSLLASYPQRLGISQPHLYNPLRRATMLPPLVQPLVLMDDFLAWFYGIAVEIYRYTVYGALVLGLFALATEVFSSSASEKTEGALIRAVWVFMVYVFSAMLYLAGQIERPDSRYCMLHLPLVALIASITVAMLCNLGRRLVEKRQGTIRYA